jgi:ParB/RepB/Spo0J family partition protein
MSKTVTKNSNNTPCVINGAVRAIKVSEIVRSKLNPRQVNKRDLKASELFESIKLNGVQHPIEVREIAKGDGKDVQYELLSGERRVAIAEELKLKTIPGIVYVNMSDAEAYEKTHFENIGREDLTPLELATDARNLMQIYQDDIKAVASALGVNEKAVKLRLQLSNLSPAWVKALSTPRPAEETSGASVHDLTIAHLELIARMEHEIQDELLGDKEQPIPRLANYGGVISVSSLKSLIASEYTMSLSGVPWKLDDESLPELGSCQKCAKRSDSEIQRELWDGEDEEKKTKGKRVVRCLDGRCFELKLQKWQDKFVEEARKEHEHLRVIGYGDAKTRYGELAVSPGEVVEAKKSDKNAFPVIVLNGAETGLSYAKLRENGRNKADNKEVERPKTLAQKRQQLKGLRIGLVLEKLKACLDKGAMPLEKRWTVELMAALVAVYGGTGQARTDQKNAKTIEALAKGDKVLSIRDWGSKHSEADTRTILWWKIVKDLKEAMNHKNASEALCAGEQAKWLAELVGFDWDKAFEEACEEKKEPKAWASLNEDGTPKSEKPQASEAGAKSKAA